MTPDARAAADRYEAKANAQERHARERVASIDPESFCSSSDELLQRLVERDDRMISRHDDGTHPLPKSDLSLTRTRLHSVRREQTRRATLARTWFATEDGTNCYIAFEARGGIEAVKHHGAPPPSYALAEQLDSLDPVRAHVVSDEGGEDARSGTTARYEVEITIPIHTSSDLHPNEEEVANALEEIYDVTAHIKVRRTTTPHTTSSTASTSARSQASAPTYITTSGGATGSPTLPDDYWK